MRNVNVAFNGGLVVSAEDAVKMPLSHYTYKKKNGGEVPNYTIFKQNGKTYVKFPRNLDKFLRYQNITSAQVAFHDLRVKAPIKKFSLSDTFSLRDYQETPVKDVVKTIKTSTNNSCVLQAEPGFGKSFILPYVVNQIGQRTLILVDRTLLLDQMVDEFTNNSSAEVVVLNRDTTELGDVNITTFQLLLTNPRLIKLLQKQIGLVVVDECHVAPAKEFSTIISQLPARYRLGLSATPTRSDGLTAMIADTFGYDKVVGVNPNSLAVHSIVVKTGIPVNFKSEKDYAKSFQEAMFKVMPNRKDTYIEFALQTSIALKDKGRRVFIYLTYGKLQKYAKHYLENFGYTVGIIDGKTSSKKRAKIIQDFEDGKLDFLVSGVILQKGISIYVLDTIVNLAPQNKENMEQVKGRLKRPHKNKKHPLFIYFTFGGKMFFSDIERVDKLIELSTGADKYSVLTVEQLENSI